MKKKLLSLLLVLLMLANLLPASALAAESAMAAAAAMPNTGREKFLVVMNGSLQLIVPEALGDYRLCRHYGKALWDMRISARARPLPSAIGRQYPRVAGKGL